jgi:hypothetical protein
MIFFIKSLNFRLFILKPTRVNIFRKSSLCCPSSEMAPRYILLKIARENAGAETVLLVKKEEPVLINGNARTYPEGFLRTD